MTIVATLGYRHHPPNLAQRGVRWLTATRSGAWLLSLTLRHIDRAVLRLTAGRSSFTSLAAGLPVIVLTSLGARSGRRRSTTMLGIPVGEGLAVAGGDFGQPTIPQWTHNLHVHPEAEVGYHGRSVHVRARPATPIEAKAAIAAAIDVYPPFAIYVERCRNRPLPVFLLEPLEPVDPCGRAHPTEGTAP
jgi:deazaflavin-dependent oxidoreductase (nitroreductase family)